MAEPESDWTCTLEGNGDGGWRVMIYDDGKLYAAVYFPTLQGAKEAFADLKERMTRASVLVYETGNPVN